MAVGCYLAAGCIQHDCRHVDGLQVHYLVLHQGHQGSDYQCKTCHTNTQSNTCDVTTCDAIIVQLNNLNHLKLLNCA